MDKPSDEITFEDVWALNQRGTKQGGKHSAQQRYFEAIHVKLISADVIYEKYKEYIQFIERKNAMQPEERYHKEKMPLETWLGNEKWDEDYSVKSSTTFKDKYFYGE